ncbi:unnamed protein product [Urochloa humidicola]
MSCQKLSREFLHIVSTAGRGMYALSHMDASRLFYPSKQEAQAAAQAKDKSNGSKILPRVLEITGRLPESSIHYEPFGSDPNRSKDVFALFGKSRILCSDSVGNTSIYDTEARSLQGMPRMNSPKGPKRITVCIPRTEAHARSDFDIDPDVDSKDFCTPDRSWLYHEALFHSNHRNSLYVMDMDPDNLCNFEALVHYPIRRWRWRRLPSPAFFGNPNYGACDNVPFVVVDGTKICISINNATYYFDTVAMEWRKAGDWMLPFRGKAEFIPELGLWLGFSARKPYDLCSVNLSGVTMGCCDTQPMARYVGQYQDVELPAGECSLKKCCTGEHGLRKVLHCAVLRSYP